MSKYGGVFRSTLYLYIYLKIADTHNFEIAINTIIKGFLACADHQTIKKMLQLKAQYNSNKGSFAPLEKLQKIENRKLSRTRSKCDDRLLYAAGKDNSAQVGKDLPTFAMICEDLP